MIELVDITSVLSVPAFVVLIWQMNNLNSALKDANARYERLVDRVIEAMDEVKHAANSISG